MMSQGATNSLLLLYQPCVGRYGLLILEPCRLIVLYMICSTCAALALLE